MKKVSRQKLTLTAETIRSLTPANLGTVAGGVVVVVTSTINTTHSIVAACGTLTTSGSIGTSESTFTGG